MTSKRHQPCMPLYGDDFWGSETVLRMSEAGQLRFMRLLWFQHKEGSIPADTRTLARMLGITHRAFLRTWVKEQLRDAFFPVEGHPDRLANSRMERVKEDTGGLSAAKSAAGKKGAQVRWERERARKAAAKAEADATEEPMAPDGTCHGTANGKPMAEPWPPTPIPSDLGHPQSQGVHTPGGTDPGPQGRPEPEVENDPGDLGAGLTEEERGRLEVLTDAEFGTPRERVRKARDLHDVTPVELASLWQAAGTLPDVKRPKAWFATIVRKGLHEVRKAVDHVRDELPPPARPVQIPRPKPRRPAPTRDEAAAAAAEIDDYLAGVGLPGSPKAVRDLVDQAAAVGLTRADVARVWDQASHYSSDPKQLALLFRREVEAQIRQAEEDIGAPVIPFRREQGGEGREAAHG